MTETKRSQHVGRLGDLASSLPYVNPVHGACEEKAARMAVFIIGRARVQ
jgi:hypothetical protein